MVKVIVIRGFIRRVQGASGRLLTPHGEHVHQTAKVLLHHLKAHLVIDGLHFLLREALCQQKRYDETISDREILTESFIVLSAEREIKHVRFLLDIDETCILEEPAHHWGLARYFSHVFCINEILFVSFR